MYKVLPMKHLSSIRLSSEAIKQCTLQIIKEQKAMLLRCALPLKVATVPKHGPKMTTKLFHCHPCKEMATHQSKASCLKTKNKIFS